MTLKLVDSTNLDPTQMAPHWPNILACIEKYCDRFGEEETPEHVIGEVAKGNRRMWLVLDEEDKVVLVPITSIETLDATGLKQLLLAECGGTRLKEAMPLLGQIEDWARQEHGAERARFIARKGWTDYLTPLGYKATAIVFDKEL
jgi:hypothetical protein